VHRVSHTGFLIGSLLSLASAAANADVVAVVSIKSPITALTQNQIGDLFFGKASHFPNGVQAMPIDQQEGSPARDAFYLRVAGKSAGQIKAYWSKIIFTGRGQPPPTVSNNVEMKKCISKNPTAIGYIDREAVDSSVRVVF
jgi:ABC-type phosphate transport system substrate-binding protein